MKNFWLKKILSKNKNAKKNGVLFAKSQKKVNKKNLCNTNNIGYRWTCETCKNEEKNKCYEGETSQSTRLQGKEHLRGLENKNENNVLYKHQLSEHPAQEANFKMEITGLFKKALTRQANGAVRIKNHKKS